MQRRTVIAVLVVAIFLTLPLASAGWKGRGFFEPDTAADRGDGYMWLETDTTPGVRGSRVYFSVYSTLYPTPVNPNLGALHSALLQYPTDVHAVLGVWKDCNKDGYIGLAEGALADYRAELLLGDDSVCPAVPGGVRVHNDGAWIRELLVIGPDFFGNNQEPSPEADTYAWNIADETARVWADWGLPADKPTTTCLALPGSEGNLQSTGGFLRWADCLAAWRITGTINYLDDAAGGNTGLAFDDAPKERPDQSGSALNQPNPWGQEEDAAYAVVFDCSSSTPVPDPTGQLGDDNGNLAYVPGVSGAVNPTGSMAGTVNETWEAAADDCDRTNDDGGLTGGQIYEAVEGDQEANPVTAKVQTGVWFEYYEPRQQTCSALNDGGLASCSGVVCGPATGCTPQFLGAWPNAGPYGGLVSVQQTGVWRGLPGYVASRNPYYNRDTLQPWGAVHLTGYAYVDPALGLSVPGGSATSTYGSDHCNGTTPITGAWECDPDKWYLGPNKQSIKRPFQVAVGASYNLRDIDCFDASPSTSLLPAVNTGHIGAYQCTR